MADYLVAVFTDLVKSSEAWKRIHREPMVALMGEYRHIAEGTASEFGSIHNSFTGDGHFFLFRNADAAVRFGLTLIERWAKAFDMLPALSDHEPISLRIGAHFGDEAKLGDMWVGRCGNIAKRIESKADPDSLFVSEGILDLIDYPLYTTVPAGESGLEGDYVDQRTLHCITEFKAGAFLKKPEGDLTPGDWFLRAAALVGTDRENTDEEARCYKRALELWPNYPEAHNSYGVLLDERHRPEEAEERYKEALRLNPDYAKAHNNYGALLDEQSRPGEAEEHYKEALRLKPDYTEAHNNYAVLLCRNRPQEAEKHFEDALRLRPDYANAHYNYANLLRRYRTKEAEEHYREALRLRPDHQAFKRAVKEERWHQPPPDGGKEKP